MSIRMHLVGCALLVAASFISTISGITDGSYGGPHWHMVFNTNCTGGDCTFVDGTIEGDCSIGTIGNLTEVNNSGTIEMNFTVCLNLQFNSNADAACKLVSITDGNLDTDDRTLTGTFSTGSYSERFQVVRGEKPDIYKCISGADRLGVGVVTATLVAIALMWQ